LHDVHGGCTEAELSYMVFDVLGFLRVPVFRNLTKTATILLKTYMRFVEFRSQMKQHFISGANFLLDFSYFNTIAT
jgi:hypothetical protein